MVSSSDFSQTVPVSPGTTSDNSKPCGVSLTGKVCIVTGSSRGIGKAIAVALAQNGAAVYATATSLANFYCWADTERSVGPGKIVPLAFDVSDPAACREAVLGVKRSSGRIDALVNNAGVEYNELIGMIDDEHLTHMLDVNVRGPINMIQAVSRIMGRQGGGSIVNIASRVGESGNAGQLAYSATKGAVIALTKSAAKELGSKGIRVNAVSPGLTDTDMMKAASRDNLSGRIENISLGRLVQPEEIANMCLFLISDASSFVSGQVIAVDGCSVL